MRKFTVTPKYVKASKGTRDDDAKDTENVCCASTPDAYKRVFIVNDADTGLPISGQGYGPDGRSYGTLQECIDRLNREVAECHKCGLDEITDKDFEIQNVETREIVL